MNKILKLLLTLSILLLCGVNSVFSQEWEYLKEYSSSDNTEFSFWETVELSDGNICVTSLEYIYRSGMGDFYSGHPAIMKISADGKYLCKNNFFKEGYMTESAPYLFEDENGHLHALTTYSPEHDYTCDYYFQNFDNPPSEAVIVLYELDDDLNVTESHEHSFPIDTYECGNAQWQYMPNEHSGHIFLFSAFEDEGDIIGAYFKTVSLDSNNPRGSDSLFFFRMNFDGEILNRKGYEAWSHGNAVYEFSFRRNQIIKTDSHYILYKTGVHTEGASGNGEVLYYDKDFNHIATRFIKHPGYVNEVLDAENIENVSVVRTNLNTTLLATTAKSVDNPNHYLYDDNRLYELDDNLNNSSDFLPIDNYIERGEPTTRDIQPILNAVDMADDKSIYYAYHMDLGDDNHDSWLVIERFDMNMDAMMTVYYDVHDETDNILTYIRSIKTAKDGGLFLTGYARDLASDVCWMVLTKFNSYLNIEEAHANKLHLAVAYPNPGGDVLNIRTGLRNATLQVYDMQGRIIHQQIITDEVTNIDASKWNSGTYVWKLTVNNEQLTVEEGKWVK